MKDDFLFKILSNFKYYSIKTQIWNGKKQHYAISWMLLNRERGSILIEQERNEKEIIFI